MKCPACDNSLVRIGVSNLEVDACHQGCGGIWFDSFELQRIDDPREPAGETLLAIPRDPNISVDPARRRDCPRCDATKLRRHLFNPKIKVEVDECPACGGFWLDAGELELIRAAKGQLEKAAQRSNGMSPSAIRMLYRMKTADRDNA